MNLDREKFDKLLVSVKLSDLSAGRSNSSLSASKMSQIRIDGQIREAAIKLAVLLAPSHLQNSYFAGFHDSLHDSFDL